MALVRTNRSRRPSWRRALGILLVLAVVGGTVTGAMVATDTLGAGKLYERALAKVDRLLAGPVPDRSAPPTVLVEEPDASDEPEPSTGSGATSTPGPTQVPGASPPEATPTPTPLPERVPVDVDIVRNPKAVFAHELEITWCSPAGVQMTLATLGLAGTSHAFQRELQSRVHEWESYRDSHNGLWGPSAMVLALEDYGAPGYEVRAYKSRQGALRDAARAIAATRSPVILLAWRGAHTWIMTGFRADADPAIFRDARIDGGYILDPWYPDISSIWGPSDPPGTFQDDAEMVRNFLPWQRPEGRYADRDGLFISIVPTVVNPAG